MSNIRPVGDRLLIKQHKPNETYGSTGIYIPDSAQEKANIAKKITNSFFIFMPFLFAFNKTLYLIIQMLIYLF